MSLPLHVLIDLVSDPCSSHKSVIIMIFDRRVLLLAFICSPLLSLCSWPIHYLIHIAIANSVVSRCCVIHKGTNNSGTHHVLRDSRCSRQDLRVIQVLLALITVKQCCHIQSILALDCGALHIRSVLVV